MFSAKEIRINPITKEEILSKVSEYDIWKMYCENFKELNVPFKSSLYQDNNPGCRIYQKPDSRLCYKDFGTGENYDCFSYIQRKYNLTFQEALNVVGGDIGLKPSQIDFKPQFLIGKENTSKQQEKWSIDVILRTWKIYDYNYWHRYNLSFDDVERGGFFPISHCYMSKSDKTIVFKDDKSNPMYASKEFHWKTKEFIGYKIYRPLNSNKSYRFISPSGVGNSIIGWEELPEKHDCLIWSKARKDVILYNQIGYYAISAQSENSFLPEDAVNELITRFSNIYIQLDNDNSGKKASENLQNRYKFRILYISEYTKLKDLGQMSIHLGLKESYNIINKLIWNHMEE